MSSTLINRGARTPVLFSSGMLADSRTQTRARKSTPGAIWIARTKLYESVANGQKCFRALAKNVMRINDFEAVAIFCA